MTTPTSHMVPESPEKETTNSTSELRTANSPTPVTKSTPSLSSFSTFLNQSSASAYMSQADGGGSGGAGTAVAIIISLIAVAAIMVFSYFYFRKKGKLSKLPCWRPMTRSRKSSTSSSRRALEDQEDVEITVRHKRGDKADEMFTIDDFDNNHEQARDEYYYDEVFGQSQFEDERTNNAMRHLYSDCEAIPSDEMLDVVFDELDNGMDNISDTIRHTAT